MLIPKGDVYITPFLPKLKVTVEEGIERGYEADVVDGYSETVFHKQQGSCTYI